MGFTTGFTGGVTLTLGVAYLTVLAHQRNREAQSHILRSQNHDRENLVESAKYRWNKEVENAVRWAQRTDWAEVRETLEGNVARLWGGAIDKTAEVGDRAAPLAKEVVEGAKQKGAILADEQGESLRQEAKSARPNCGRRGAVKAVVGEVVEKGRKEAGAAVVKVQQAAGIVEDKVSIKEDGKVLPAGSPVQQALHQRYEKPSGLTKTVKEVLAERYQRVDERDNTQLRGL
uniref:MICOS complex subunit MIC12 n=1 Tax=Colletotrichum fructicola (strain Nara gc5) TaxID=1213859 RepID=L2GB15_COLFN